MKGIQSAVEPSRANLERFSSLLVDPLRRAIALATSAADVDTQSLLQASLHLYEPTVVHLRLIQTFDAFWKETFGPVEHEVDLSHELSDLLQIVRGIVHAPETARWDSTSEPVIDSMPIPAQAVTGLPEDYRTGASEDRVLSSRAGYDADVSLLPPLPGSRHTSGVLPAASAARRSLRKAISPSLRAPTDEQAMAVVASTSLEAEGDTQMVDETQSDVLTREANASFAAMSSRLLSPEPSDSAVIDHDMSTGIVSKGKSRRRPYKALISYD